MTTTNIYQQIKKVKTEIGHIIKDKTNDFQKFKYVDEYTYLKIINPILEKNGLVMTFEDTDIPVNFQEKGKELIVIYQKQVILTDVDTQQSLTFKTWGMGQNIDIAKAKGSADTYAVKYFLQKFFMIPTSDKENLDPDAMSNDPDEKYPKVKTLEKRELTETEQKQANEVLERHGFDILSEKCSKCGHEFSAKLLKEAKTKAGEIKKLCFACYDKIIKIKTET